MIMNLKKAMFSTASILLLAQPAFANDGTITFTGNVSAASCTVSGGSTAGGASSTDLSVTLPSMSVSSIGTNAGDAAGHTAFSITLTDCISPNETPVNMRIAFSGIGADEDQYVLKNTAATQPATGVGIKLFADDMVTPIDINNGANKMAEIELPKASETASTVVVNFMSAYVNTKGGAPTAGAVEATANYLIEYN